MNMESSWLGWVWGFVYISFVLLLLFRLKDGPLNDIHLEGWLWCPCCNVFQFGYAPAIGWWHTCGLVYKDHFYGSSDSLLGADTRLFI